MRRAICYTDGSCGKNKDGGWACILAIAPYEDQEQIVVEMAGWEENTTNNRMEMLAAIRGLEYLKESHIVFLASDSAYMLNTLKHKWYEDWFRLDKDRKNLDLWKQLVDLTQKHNMEYVKVKGHANDDMNNKVDHMAVQARKEKLEYTNVYSSAT